MEKIKFVMTDTDTQVSDACADVRWKEREFP